MGRRFVLLVVVVLLASAANATVQGALASDAGALQEAQRINSLTLQFSTSVFAPNNAFGSAFGGAAQSSIQNLIGGTVTSGATSLIFQMLGLSDLTGTNADSLGVGLVNGSPQIDAGNPATYNGNSDLDWWYTPSASDIDANGVPKLQLNGSIVSKGLTASGPQLAFEPSPFGIGASNGPLNMSSVALSATVGSSSAPLESTNNFPPGHLPSEHIDPSSVTFATMSNGLLRGNLSAASLAQIPVPPSLAGTNCVQQFTATNSLLDVLVSGCTYLGIIQVIKITQPDQVDPAAPIAGSGGPYTLVTNVAHQVTGCKDKSSAIVVLSTCLAAAAYSASFAFTTDRVIVPPPSPVDLTETAVSNPPASQNVGSKFTVTDTVLNDGTVATPVTTYTRYYLSLDPTRDASDRLLTGTRSVGSLPPLATSTGSTKVGIPTMTTGDYYLLACADDTNLVIESDESNNCTASATTLSVTAPDLVVSSLASLPSAMAAGTSFPEATTTANVGNGPARASTTRFYLSLNKAKSATDVLLSNTDSVGSLAPGASESDNPILTIPSGTLGRYYLLGCSDDLKAVRESNEKNNCTASVSRVKIS
jgi:hypothetical protein